VTSAPDPGGAPDPAGAVIVVSGEATSPRDAVSGEVTSAPDPGGASDPASGGACAGCPSLASRGRTGDDGVASVARAGAEGDPAADACVPEDVVPGIVPAADAWECCSCMHGYWTKQGLVGPLPALFCMEFSADIREGLVASV
jgi:hypothetical protein